MSGEVLDDRFELLAKRACGTEQLLGLLDGEPFGLLDIPQQDSGSDLPLQGTQDLRESRRLRPPRPAPLAALDSLYFVAQLPCS